MSTSPGIKPQNIASLLNKLDLDSSIDFLGVTIRSEINDLIGNLRDSEDITCAEASVLFFTIFHQYEFLNRMYTAPVRKLHYLWNESLINADPLELATILEKPCNKKIRELFLNFMTNAMPNHNLDGMRTHIK